MKAYVYVGFTPTGYVVDMFSGGRYVSRVRRRYVKTEHHARRLALRWADDYGPVELRGLVRDTKGVSA